MFKFFAGEKPAIVSEEEPVETKVRKLAEEYRLQFGDVMGVKMTEIEEASQEQILRAIQASCQKLGTGSHLEIFRFLNSHGVDNVLAAEISEKIGPLPKF